MYIAHLAGLRHYPIFSNRLNRPNKTHYGCYTDIIWIIFWTIESIPVLIFGLIGSFKSSGNTATIHTSSP